jgi:hypothetical protein
MALSGVNGASPVSVGSSVYRVDDAETVHGQIAHPNPASTMDAGLLEGTFLVEGPDNQILVFDTQEHAALAAESERPMTVEGYMLSF